MVESGQVRCTVYGADQLWHLIGSLQVWSAVSSCDAWISLASPSRDFVFGRVLLFIRAHIWNPTFSSPACKLLKALRVYSGLIDRSASTC